MTAPLILDINPYAPRGDIIMKAAAILRDDGLIVAPTETRYGLLARHDHRRALEKMIKLKGRKAEIPVALFVPSIADISKLGELNHRAEALAHKYLPGPLTLVLKAKRDLGPPLAVDGKIGIRYSSSEVIKALLAVSDFYPTATSANLSGHEQPVTVDEIAAMLGDSVSLYLNSGPLAGDVSTVVDCSGAVPIILREGAITKSEIDRFLETA